MGYEARRLDGVAEAVRRLVAPFGEGFGLGQMVEAGVELDRREGFRIVAEPAMLGHFLRIEEPPPVAVDPPRAADAHGSDHEAFERNGTGISCVGPAWTG